MRTKGWAIVLDDEIDVATVSPHARGAKVNWLHRTGHVVLNGYTDFQIERMWQMHHGKAECLPVTILAGLQ